MNDDTLTMCRVLLVDDEENILRSISRLLMDEEDLMVFTATSGEEGLKTITADPGFALILSDQRMPGMSGAEFLQKTREIAPDAVRMVLTGYADITATMDAINKGGASRYITKPWDDNMLLQTIRDGVRQYRLVQENRRLTDLVQKQNLELQEWNTNLKQKVMDHTVTIRKQNEELSERSRRIEESFQGIMSAFSRLVELCGRRQQSHARNVTEISVGIARDLGLGEKEIETIQTAALLHDIGEIGIPDAILMMRMSEMSEEEKRLYLQHAVRGQTTIDSVPGLREVGELIRHHHEHFDGSGFPDRLAGEAIPLGARIMATADYIDREMAGQSGEIALDMTINRAQGQSGKMLDPALLKHARRYARYLYFSATSQPRDDADRESRPGEAATELSDLQEMALHMVETEYTADALVPGLQLTRNLLSGTGLLLLAKGTVLDRHKIDSVKRYYMIDPPQGGIFAFAPGKTK